MMVLVCFADGTLCRSLYCLGVTVIDQSAVLDLQYTMGALSAGHTVGHHDNGGALMVQPL